MLVRLPGETATTRRHPATVLKSAGAPVTGIRPSRGRMAPAPRLLPQRPATKGDDVRRGGSNSPQQALDLGFDPLAVRELVYTSAERLTLDERPAEDFFGVPRIGAVHTDAGFTERLTALYRGVLVPLAESASESGSGSPGCCVVDLCSSSHSHLPAGLRLGQVVGHGMNAAELAANPALSSSFVQDLNHRTALPLPPSSAHAVLCCNGLQYLTRPEWVAVEVARVLRPGGVAVVAFSGACWAERAAAGWLSRDAEQRLQVVRRLLENAGLVVTEEVRDEPAGGSSTTVSSGEGSGGSITGSAVGDSDAIPARGSDPLYAVVARKPDVARGSDDVGLAVMAPEPSPTEVAAAYVGPALRELDLNTSTTDTAQVTPLTLDRWRDSYSVLVEDAASLGIPRSAIPALPANARPAEIRAARDHLQAMIESFLSAGL